VLPLTGSRPQPLRQVVASPRPVVASGVGSTTTCPAVPGSGPLPFAGTLPMSVGCTMRSMRFTVSPARSVLMPTPALIEPLVTVQPGSVGSFHTIPTPVPARSALQSALWESQFHSPLTEIVTVPSPLSTVVALIVPVMGLPASADAFAAHQSAAPMSTSRNAAAVRRVQESPVNLAMPDRTSESISELVFRVAPQERGLLAP
jgi:hypothetical protein